MNNNMKKSNWPEFGSKFYYLNSDGTATEDIFENNYKCLSLKKFGNFFQTLEEAKDARDKIFNLLNKN